MGVACRGMWKKQGVERGRCGRNKYFKLGKKGNDESQLILLTQKGIVDGHLNN